MLKGGAEEPRFPRLPPPSAWWGGAEAGHPVRSRSVGSGSFSALRGAEEAPRPPQLVGPPAPASLQTPRESLLPPDLSPCCCGARPSGSQGGARAEPAPPAPTSPFGSLTLHASGIVGCPLLSPSEQTRCSGAHRQIRIPDPQVVVRVLSQHHGAQATTSTHPCPPRMRLRSSTQGQRRQTSLPPCPVMWPPRLPPAATPAACAGVAVAVAPGVKGDGEHGGPPGRASCSPSPAAKPARQALRRCRAGRSPLTS